MAVYACSDLHGMMDAYKAIKSLLKPEDKVYFLGDAGDRGPESWELIRHIYSDPQFIYMKGNHEDMLVRAMREYIYNDERTGHDYSLLVSNGGATTFYDWSCLNDHIREEWMRRLNKLPYVQEYTNQDGFRIIMTHAGFTPAYTTDNEIAIPCEEDALWDRYHFTDPWPHDTEKVVIIHGHTPTFYLAEKLRLPKEEVELGAMWYAQNHKICLDCGCFFTGCTCLLNLDTFDEEVITL